MSVLAVESATASRDTNEHKHLELLARVKKALASAKNVSVPITDIRRYEKQPRKHFDAESIRRLAVSIDTGGQTTPGMIREKKGPTKYELIDGERRWRAVAYIPEARRPLYDARLIEADDDVVQFLISGVANFNREGHTELEVTETIDRLLKFGLPIDEIANLLGISRGWAEQMHGLKKLSPEVTKLLDHAKPKSERLPLTAAIQISKMEPRLQLGLAQRVISKDISLPRLRGEVIRVAKIHNSPLRIREVRPSHQWDSFQNKFREINRIAGDAEAVLNGGAIDAFVGRNLQTVQEVGRTIENIADILTRIMTKLSSSPPKK